MTDISEIQLDMLPGAKPQQPNQSQSGEPQFSKTLKDMIEQVDDFQKKSGKEIKGFIAGEQGNLHEVMAAVEEAQLSFQLMLEIRNKLLESYQELSRMQV